VARKLMLVITGQSCRVETLHQAMGTYLAGILQAKRLLAGNRLAWHKHQADWGKDKTAAGSYLEAHCHCSSQANLACLTVTTPSTA